jgi:hypothetical protein
VTIDGLARHLAGSIVSQLGQSVHYVMTCDGSVRTLGTIRLSPEDILASSEVF